MLSGVCQIANAVQVTLGPKGRNVAIDQSYGTCKITKDGVTVAKSIDLSDKMEDMGAQLIKKVASQTNESAGDGTTTATILAREIFVAGYKAVSSGANPVDVQRGINTAAKHAIKVLKQNAKKIDDKDLIQVATISANNDPHIGALITKAMNSVGTKGIISVNKGQKSEDSLEVVKGFKFDKGMSNAIFMTDAKSQKAVFEEPLILVVESKVSDYEGIVELLDHARSEGKALVIIADEVEGAALSTLVLNRLKSGLNCCAIKPPSFGDNRRDMLSDIALATGATFVTKESGISIKDLKPEMLGSCEKMEVTMESTLMIKGAGDKNAVKKRAEELKSRIGNSSGSEYETDVLKRRLGFFF
ncbi:hypothetical protein MHBO_003702 [Bonamia ostreae]|uniref:Heat shock protein 60 n=1 Tax=Bonamia ostreae TaxID=126728 RepID=A0ABV2AR79_9EUKA